MTISKIQSVLNTPGLAQVQTVSSGSGLGDVASTVSTSFNDYLQQLSASENTSDDLLQKLSAGEDVDLHQIMIATEQTDVNFRVAMAIRDRLVDAYKEIMRMTV
jgi:flagellar hook-basal body complex protein FliE